MAVQSVAYRNNPDYNIGIITLLGPDAGIQVVSKSSIALPAISRRGVC